MAQIGTVKLQTQNSGVVDVPVFETGDSGSSTYEFVRVQTGSGTGFIPVTNTNDAAYPYLRVQSQNNGVVAVTDSASAIPDSAIHRYNAKETGFSDGETVHPWDDLIGSIDLDVVDAPTLEEGSLNGNDAITVDGVDDGYTYDNIGLSEPATVIIAYHQEKQSGDLETIWFEDAGENELINHQENDEIVWWFDGNDEVPSGESFVGDAIVTMAIDDTDAIVRVNGSQVASVSSSSGVDVLTSGAFFHDTRDGGKRFVSRDVGEVIAHNERLTGSDLDEEEQRVEDEFGMDVL